MTWLIIAGEKPATHFHICQIWNWKNKGYIMHSYITLGVETDGYTMHEGYTMHSHMIYPINHQQNEARKSWMIKKQNIQKWSVVSYAKDTSLPVN